MISTRTAIAPFRAARRSSYAALLQRWEHQIGDRVDAGAIIDWASASSAALLAAELFPGTTPTETQQRHLRAAGELQTRLVLSFVLTPHTTIDRSTPAALRAYVLNFIVPLITGWNGAR